MRGFLWIQIARGALRGTGFLSALILLTALGCKNHPARAPAADVSGAASGEVPSTDGTDTPPEPAPPPSGPWAPIAPVASETDEIAWAQVELQSACSERPASQDSAPPVHIITTEADFERAYCRKSEVDWSRFRLVAIHYLDHLVDVTLVRDESQVRVLMQTRKSCEPQWGDRLYLLLPAEDAHVVVVRKPGPRAECADGYGY